MLISITVKSKAGNWSCWCHWRDVLFEHMLMEDLNDQGVFWQSLAEGEEASLMAI
jgi:hypothetical protein